MFVRKATVLAVFRCSLELVRIYLLGGQACDLYGAAEFSRDTDFAILAEQENLAILRWALADLQAETIAVPPLEKRFLDRGHGVHFRCSHPEALRLRIDIMARMRGMEDFAALWQPNNIRSSDLPLGGSQLPARSGSGQENSMSEPGKRATNPVRF